MIGFGKRKDLKCGRRIGREGLVDISRLAVRQHGFGKTEVRFGIGGSKHQKNVALLAYFINTVAPLHAEIPTTILP